MKEMYRVSAVSENGADRILNMFDTFDEARDHVYDLYKRFKNNITDCSITYQANTDGTITSIFGDGVFLFNLCIDCVLQ